MGKKNQHGEMAEQSERRAEKRGKRNPGKPLGKKKKKRRNCNKGSKERSPLGKMEGKN